MTRTSLNTTLGRNAWIFFVTYLYVYVKYYLRFFWARCSSAAECFFSHFRQRGKLVCHGYIMKHVWVSAELGGGARRIKRRLSGSIWRGIAFRVPETSRSFGIPQIVFQILIFNGFGKRFFFSRMKIFPE